MSEIFVKCLAPWEDRSDELNRIFADAPENCTVKLEPGEYFLRKTIRIGGRKGLTIDGRGATFVLHCDRTQMAFDSTNPENPDPASGVVPGLGLTDVPDAADSASEQLITDIEAKMDSLNSFSQQTMIDLQSLTAKRDQSYDMISNILKSLNTTLLANVNNM